jgi:hypothetical protein
MRFRDEVRRRVSFRRAIPQASQEADSRNKVDGRHLIAAPTAEAYSRLRLIAARREQTGARVGNGFRGGLTLAAVAAMAKRVMHEAHNPATGHRSI